MDKLTDSINGVVETMADAGRQETKNALRNSMPALGEFFREVDGVVYTNPNDEEDEYEDADDGEVGYGTGEQGEPLDPYTGEDEEEDEDDEAVGMEIEGGLAFEDVDAEKDNLLLAAAAWRALGSRDDFVAQHKKTDITYFGNGPDFAEFCAQRDLNQHDWTKYTGDGIIALDYDPYAIRELLNDGLAEGLEEANEEYEKFHWGDPSTTTGVINIPGLDVSQDLVFLGVGREICYGAKKDNAFHEYYHLFGEESGTYPAVYALGDKCVVVIGGGMHIEPRGIVD